ncbi:MAG: hypothetical protein ABI665_06330 [Vicinamibacterales bacterium]
MSGRSPIATPLVVVTPPGAGRYRQCEPVTVGLPLPIGLTHDPSRIALEDDHGGAVPLQARPTEYWADGSLKWVLLDFQVEGNWTPHRRYTLRIGEAAAPVTAPRLVLEEGPSQVTIDTGAAQFVVRTGLSWPFARVVSGGAEVIDCVSSGLFVTTPAGDRHATRVTRVTLEERGPLRATVRIDGVVGESRRLRLQLTARLHFFAGSSAVRLATTVRNPRRARHKGGIWELGDHGSIYLRDASLHLSLAVPATQVDCAIEAQEALSAVALPFELYQDSSGGEHWNSHAHVDRHGEVPCTFRGYRCQSSTRRTSGLRATPALLVQHDRGRVGIAVEHFWQDWPKAVSVEPALVIFRLFPGQCANEHELQGGEQKTHRFTLMFGDDPLANDARFWGREPALVRATPAWYCDSGAVPHLPPAGTDRYQPLVDAAIDGPETFEHKRELADEYGWRHFGDIYADHENAFSGQPDPVVSHYNNQYDAVGGFAIQFMRTGGPRWHRLMSELAAHVSDIDIYHTDSDKSAYNHGLFWHTAHYVTAGRSSHRSFPKDPRVHGGGPANEHNYTAGLRLHWLLTGDRQSREGAIELAQWVIDMDDGSRTVLRWLSSGDTGLASQTFSPSFHGPGRGAGHSILALLDGHRLTKNEKFLAKAEQLIRRCVHPADDIAALNLLDAERRWSYTVFMQALGKYLDYMVELERIDGGYAYARAALLHYARWMAVHEYPYLTKPEILEYPTETWAAQDIRKCEVFLFAAGHAADAERERFIERAHFFFDYSVTTLMPSKTRTLSRPLVLLLSNGFMYLSSHAADPRPTPATMPDDSFGRPTRFVPQKAIAKERLGVSVALMVVAITASILAFV